MWNSCKWNINGALEAIYIFMNVNSATLQETLDRQPEEFSEGKLADIKMQKKKCLWRKLWGCPRGSDTGKIFLMKGTLMGISLHWKHKE